MNPLANKKIIEIAQYLETAPVKNNWPNSLFSGLPGIFLFRLYYQKSLNQDNDTLSSELISFVENHLQSNFEITSLCHGLTGFSWFLMHLNEAGFIAFPEEVLKGLDALVFETGMMDFEAGNHDFMHGGLGNLYYLAKRFKSQKETDRYVFPLFEKLLESATKTENGIYWLEPSKDEDKEKINLNLSHGQACKIQVLTYLAEQDYEPAKAALREAIKFLLYCENEDQSQSIIPTAIVNGKKEAYHNLGWCRGNISIALVLSRAAIILNDSALLQKSIEIGKHTLSLNTKKLTKVTDFAFCHGMLGLAQMYGRLYEVTEVVDFKNQENYWVDYAIKEANFEDGIAGFKTWDNISKEWKIEPGLLTGLAGIGLCLLTYTNPEYGAWDSCFLLR